ncbi:gluconate 2-dehydrogenase subunit 3 family protein [Chryseolinea sp. H1M3-3]|uniref:gluconate 2-dehydrogenase subunit 3 family protein n=1 Tax=Chryseolinea sp. H1M3-3 TaxID=3034144 RepID=UPI0023EB9277|nr:gluconate 2-dehydrogenase subunit 3 family protein [Chryseolinea sp. H1M3-3]
MDRREALKRTAWLMGGAVSAPAILGILKGCTAKPTIDWKPVFLSPEQGSLITQVSEIIIPKTDTPGAKDVGVPGFIDQIVNECFTKEDQESFKKGLQEFDDAAKKEHGDSFIELDAEEQTAFVKKIHDAAVNAEDNGKRPFILTLKELTMLGFFTSEPGATQVLQYSPVPGAYKGCIPLSEAGNGKSWAT